MALKAKATETLVVVARDGVLRRSYLFALQAEGFHVEPYSSLPSAIAATRYPRTVCALVDGSALRGVKYGPELLARLRLPVILLTSESGPSITDQSVPGEVLNMPLQGAQLAECIARVRRPRMR